MNETSVPYSTYELYVSNIGRVQIIYWSREGAARQAYEAYVSMSKNGYGRAAGESVTLMRDGEPFLEYHPEH